MAGQKIAKKLPDRVNNAALKQRRSISWTRGKSAKVQRVLDQKLREKDNRNLLTLAGVAPNNERPSKTLRRISRLNKQSMPSFFQGEDPID